MDLSGVTQLVKDDAIFLTLEPQDFGLLSLESERPGLWVSTFGVPHLLKPGTCGLNSKQNSTHTFNVPR